MVGIQLISILFALSSMYFTYLKYKRKDFTGREFASWALIWAGFLVVAIFPEALSPYVQEFGFSRLMDFVVMIAFVVLFWVIMHNYWVVHKLERRLESLVRKLALKDLEGDARNQ